MALANIALVAAAVCTLVCSCTVRAICTVSVPESERVPIGRSPVRGPQTAPVTIVEVSDFQCPFCARVQAALHRLDDEYPGKIRWVFKHNPLPFHDRARPAARAALAAARQGAFWRMHDLLFERQQALGDADLAAMAAEIGLDAARFQEDMGDAALEKAIDSDVEFAGAAGVHGTPSFFINGRKIAGAQAYDAFKEVVEDELNAVEDLRRSGCRAEEVYARRVEANMGADSAGGAGHQQARKDEDSTIWRAEVPEGAASVGPAEAPVTVVVFTDFQCPFCEKLHWTLSEVQQARPDEVRVVVRHFPLPYHAQSAAAAAAVIEAAGSGKGWEAAAILFEEGRVESEEEVLSRFERLGLDPAKLRQAIATRAHGQVIDRDLADGQALYVTGTPTFYVNGRRYPSSVDREDLEKAVDEGLKRARALLDKGVPASEVYDRLVRDGRYDKAGE